MSPTKLEISSDYVAILRLNQLETKNAISRAMLASLWQQIRDVKSSKARVLIIMGSGDSFSAGADLKERALMSQIEVIQFLNDIRDCFLDLENLPMPTIACINGYAFGGGLELALACDLRYAVTTSVIGLTETKLGIIPGAGGTQRLTALVGKAQSMEWIFSAKKISASEALTKGLILGLFEKDQFEISCLEIARDIAMSAPIAVKAAKKAILGAVSEDTKRGLAWERLCYKETIPTNDRLEALAAFREKRKPIFIGE